MGHVYWWAVAPLHGIVFGGMLRNITHAAEQSAGDQTNNWAAASSR
jgi:hypothetical protein